MGVREVSLDVEVWMMHRRIFEERNFDVRGKVLSCKDFHPLGKADWRPTEKYAAFLIERAEEYLEKEIPLLTASDYAAFLKSGNRSVYEEKYFLRRELCLILSLAEFLERKGRFTAQLADAVWAILEETTWVLPAHINAPAINADVSERVCLPYRYTGELDYVDLFSAATGAALAVALYFAGDALDAFSATIAERVRFELDRRILKPFLDKRFWRNSGWQGWDGKDRKVVDDYLQNGTIPQHCQLLCNNWSPWITGNILTVAAFCERDDARREQIVETAMLTIDNFVMGYGADGACDEGPTYWAQAPGSLYNACALLFDMTGGYVNVFDDPLLRRMCEAQALISVDRKRFLTYSDTVADLKTNIGLLGRFGERCHSELVCAFVADRIAGGAVVESRERLLIRRDNPYDWLEDLAWQPSCKTADRYAPPRRVLFEDLGLFIAREYAEEDRGLYLAIKSGHNQQSHNHNDVGAFVIYHGADPIFLDAGTGTYTAKTFGDERYTIWNTRSDYHNLPTVNGQIQKFGLEYRATDVCVTENSYSMELREAYGADAAIRSFRRTATLTEGTVTVEDRILLSREGEVMFHYLTDTKPQDMRDGSFRLHGATVTYPAGMRITVETVDCSDEETRVIPKQWGVEALYRVNLYSPCSAEHLMRLTVS